MEIKMRVPDAPPPLLPGKTAMYWVKRFLKVSVVVIVAVLLMPVASLLPVPSRLLVLGFLLVIILTGCTLGIHASVQSGRAELRERNAGYTTQYRARYELWQLDPTTGDVLRRPGERQARKRG